MKFAQVLEVYLNEDDPKIEGIDNGPYTIQALLKNGSSNQTILATPLNINEKYIPVVGEYVGVQKAPSDFNSGIGFGRTVFYYTSPVALQKNINNNILENAGQLDASETGGGYAAAGAGISVSTNPSAGDKKNKELLPKIKEISDRTGRSFKPINEYVHRVVFQSKDRDRVNILDKAEKYSNLSTRGRVTFERTPGAKPIDYNPFNSVLLGTQETLLDYYMSPAADKVQSVTE